MKNTNPLPGLLRATRPLNLLGVILVYALGVGISRYLGESINWTAYLLGQAWVTLVQIGGHFLYAYFNHPAAEDPGQSSRNNRDAGEEDVPRATLLFIAAASLAIVASFTVLLMKQVRVTPAALLVMLLLTFGAIAYSVPPLRLSRSGYGELSLSIMISNLVPALAFLLQSGELHRLVAMSTFPLTALYLAMLLAYELPTYALDLKNGNLNLMVRLGWERGMAIHNGLILAAFLLLGLAVTLGMPLAIGLPAFAPLALGLLQIWQMRRLADGFRPNWTTLTITPLVMFAMAAYLLAFAFWTR